MVFRARAHDREKISSQLSTQVAARDFLRSLYVSVF